MSVSTRPDPEGSGTVEIATRRCPRLRVVWDLRELTHQQKTQAMEPSRQTWSSYGPPYPLGRWPWWRKSPSRSISPRHEEEHTKRRWSRKEVAEIFSPIMDASLGGCALPHMQGGVCVFCRFYGRPYRRYFVSPDFLRFVCESCVKMYTYGGVLSRCIVRCNSPGKFARSIIY